MRLIRFIRISCVVLALVGVCFSQNMPYPQSKKINNGTGIKPTCISQAEMNRKIKELYAGWKLNWVRKSTSAGQFYLYSTGTGGTANQITISEAHGFGMIIFALMAGADDSAKIYFDGMYNFYKRFELSNHLMNWAIEAGEKVSAESKGSATDGDIDIAYALLLADKQWGGSYKADGVDMINGIMANEVTTSLNTTTLGYWPSGAPNPTDSRPSDWMPAEFRSFAAAGGSASWNTMADQAGTFFKMFQNNNASTTGLISDFVINLTSSSITACGANFLGEYTYTNKYFYNACRVPMRFALDYAHFGTAAAKEALSKTLTWLDATKTRNNPNLIVNGYDFGTGGALPNLTAEGYESGESIGFTGPFMAACIVDPKFQKFLDKGYYCLTRAEMWAPSVSQEYEQSIALLSMLTLSGNWWKPGDANTKYPDPVVNTVNTAAFDGFGNGFGGSIVQNDLSAKVAIDKGKPANAYAAVWMSDWAGAGGVYNQKGGTLLANKKDISPLISNGEMHAYFLVKGKTSTDEDIYAQVNCPLIGDSRVFNTLDSLNGITLRIKGTGTLRIEFFTKDIMDLPVALRWGFYGYDLKLSPTYTDVQIPVAYFTPSVYSPPEDSGWGYPNMKGGKRIMQLNLAGPYPTNITQGAECEFWLDTMYLNGVKYSDITNVGTTDITGKNAVRNQCFLKCKAFSGTVSVSYLLENATSVSIKICTMQGREVASFRSDMQQQGKHTLDLATRRPLAKGVYMIRFAAGKRIVFSTFEYIR